MAKVDKIYAEIIVREKGKPALKYVPAKFNMVTKTKANLTEKAKPKVMTNKTIEEKSQLKAVEKQ